jgi:hypothetical protein
MPPPAPLPVTNATPPAAASNRVALARIQPDYAKGQLPPTLQRGTFKYSPPIHSPI